MQNKEVQKHTDPTDPDADPEHCLCDRCILPVIQRESSYGEAEKKAMAAVT